MLDGKRLMCVGCVWLAFAVSAALGAEHLMRFADVHGDRVVFTYEGDLWLAPTAGGEARRITRDGGLERFAKFSPDGSKIAFTANYDGGTDVYVIDAGGGVPTRLTYHPASDVVLDWFPDGSAVLFRSRRQYSFRAEEIYRVALDGGMPEPLPVDRAGLTALSPDGTRIAYNRISREFRNWKRYQGGMAQDIWMGSLDERNYRKITDWPGTDNFPMWHGQALYFTSDRERGRLNLYQHDLASGQVSALTSYADYDVKYPSLGGDHIVYQHAEALHLLDLTTARTRKLDITLPSDSVMTRAHYVPATSNLGSFNLSPSGKRMLLETRGEIVNIPVEEGQPINLTQRSASREKNAAWSPDGRRVALISDDSGEEEVYLIDPRAEEPWRQLTSGGGGFRMALVWSPDSKWLAFSDKSMRLNLVEAETGRVRVIDQGHYDDGWERWGIQDYVWSPDSRWLAYTKLEANLYESIFLYGLAEERSYRVTSRDATDFSPSFDPQGEYLYFLSNRTFEPIMGFVDQNHIFFNMCRPYAVILAEGGASPFAPRDEAEPLVEADDEDEEAGSPDGEAEDTDDAADSDEDPAPTKITPSDFERRTVVVEDVPAGNYFRLQATAKGFYYLAKDQQQFLKYQNVTDTTGDKLDLYHYELRAEPDKRKPKSKISGINNYHLSTDGKKLVYRSGNTFGVVDVGAEAKVGDGGIDLDAVKIKIDPRAEFTQIFNEAWRVQRDWFYDADMHDVDWQAVREQYQRFLPDCGDRSDVNYLIAEMIAELNAGHTYVYGGDIERRARRVSTGLLGVDFETPPGAAYHRIAHIVPGGNWSESERSPLWTPEAKVQEGHYLIAIDGQEVRSNDNVYRLLENKANAVITLATNERPSPEGAEISRVRTLRSERGIRYREWVAINRARVEDMSSDQVAYVHLPNMMEAGLIEFARSFFPAHNKAAMVLDIRYNGGGFVGDMIIDRLERELWAITQPREGKSIRNPERDFHGHLVVVMNEDTGSNGEYFAEAIKRKGLAKLIGMRTWGGAVGIEPHQGLVDGGTTTPPQFAPYGLDGQWLIEGHGVDPDIEVQNMPGDVLAGRDAQLEAAVKYLLARLAEDPHTLPPVPEYPDKR